MLDGLDYSKIQKPQIKKTTNFQKASRAPHPLMDKVEIYNNIMVAIQEEGADVTVIPVTIKAEFLV